MTCTSCESKPATLTCGICATGLCKSCALHAGEDSLAFDDQRPKYFEHGIFCQTCFDGTVQPAIEAYNEVLGEAEQVNVYYKTQAKESGFIRRLEKPLKVTDVDDRDEAVLKLAFLAVKRGCNVLVDVELKSHKVLEGSRQTSTWSGTGVPAKVDQAKLDRRNPGSPN